MSKHPITPTKYTLTTGNDTKNFAGRNPKKLELYGKLHDTDRWTLLDSQDDGSTAGRQHSEEVILVS